jgi:hypothetical protein
MLDNIKQLLTGLGEFDAEKELQEIVSSHPEKLSDLQRDQMMEGRGVDGEFIRPFYSENPYFKSKESADRYANWKQKITPNPQRPKDVPNLYINGYFHDSLYTKFMGNEFEMESNASFGDNVFNVHKNAQGLNEEKRLLFLNVLLVKTGLEL